MSAIARAGGPQNLAPDNGPSCGGRNAGEERQRQKRSANRRASREWLLPRASITAAGAEPPPWLRESDESLLGAALAHTFAAMRTCTAAGRPTVGAGVFLAFCEALRALARLSAPSRFCASNARRPPRANAVSFSCRHELACFQQLLTTRVLLKQRFVKTPSSARRDLPGAEEEQHNARSSTKVRRSPRVRAVFRAEV